MPACPSLLLCPQDVELTECVCSRGLDLGAFLARTRLTLSLECGVAAVDLHLEVALQPEASAGVQLGNRGSQASTSSGITSADPKVTIPAAALCIKVEVRVL